MKNELDSQTIKRSSADRFKYQSRVNLWFHDLTLISYLNISQSYPVMKNSKSVNSSQPVDFISEHK